MLFSLVDSNLSNAVDFSVFISDFIELSDASDVAFLDSEIFALLDSLSNDSDVADLFVVDSDVAD